MQNAALINRGTSPVELTAVDLELLQDGRVIDTRQLGGADLTRAGASGAALQQSGMMKMFAFQFCGTALVGEGTTLAGPTLAPQQAMLLAQQPFAYRGKRDTLRLRAHGHRDGHEFEASATLPVSATFAKTAFRFPLQGVWFAAVGPTMHTGHRWALPEEFGYDIARFGDGNSSHRGTGQRFQDYYAYGATVRAAADGVVLATANDQAENTALLRRPAESAEAYGARMQELQGALLSKGAAAIAGNFVILDHGGSEYSLYAHLVPGSVRVKVGEHVAGGAPIGMLGSSGNSTEPHLHFQVCDAPDPLGCAGIPVEFQDVALPYADFPRPLQSGDVVVAK